MIDNEGKQFKKRGFEYMVYDVESELLEDSLLMKTPIVRNGKLATVGYKPEVWKEWISDNINI
jgi:arsenate reductase